VNGWTGDGIEAKPGCWRIYITDNVITVGDGNNGAALGLLFMGGSNVPPAWWDIDAEVWVEGNRIYDYSLTETNGNTSWLVYFGRSGVRMANNMFWSYADPAGNGVHRARMEPGTNATQAEAYWRLDPTWVVNSLCWSDEQAFLSAGYGSPLIGNFPAAVLATFDLRNNLVRRTSPGTGELDATSTDFVGTVPAIGVVGAADAGGGPGSAFELDAGSDLIGVGTSIADLTLLFEADIFNRPIPASGLNPGPFQEG
jgi:hypothetical protein